MTGTTEHTPMQERAASPSRRRRGGRWLRRFVVVLLVVALLVVAGVVVIVHFDWNRARPWIAERVSTSLGRPFAIEGDLDVQWLRVTDASGERSWLPWPHVFAHGVVLGNPEGAKGEHMAKVDELAFAVSPLPLLARTLDVPALRVTGGDLSLERDKDSRTNWAFAPAGDSGWNIVFGDLVLEQGRVRINDVIERIDLTFDLTPLDVPLGYEDILRREETAERAQSADTIGAPAARKFREEAAAGEGERGAERRASRAYEFAWTAKGRFREVAVEGRGRSGGILDLGDPDDPFPLQARFTAGKTRIAFVGTLTNPTALDALDLRLWVSGNSMADLFPLTRIVLPNTPPFATEGRLSVDLRAGSASATYRYGRFTGRVGGSDLAGSLTYLEARPRGRLSGELRSKLLQSSDLAEVFGVGPEAASAGDKGRFFPASSFRTARWGAMDADVTFTGERVVHSKDWPIDGVESRIRLDAGKLRLDPLRFGIAGGRIAGNVRLDGAQKPPQGEVELEARGLEMAQLLPKLASAEASFGEINGAVALAGVGDSMAGLLASANGEVKLLVEHGQVSKSLLEAAGLNLGNVLLAKLFGDRSVQLNCAAAQWVAQKGVLDARAFVIDTEDALIDISGSIDLGRERLDLEVKPESKGLRILSLRSPLTVRGTLMHPQVGVRKGPLIARGVGALVLGVFAAPAAALVPLIATSRRDDPQRCENLLARMRSTGS